MDALEFAKAKRRMCESTNRNCEICRRKDAPCILGSTYSTIEDDEKLIKAVEEWAAEHPERTRQSEFIKLFPNAPLDRRDILAVCPKNTQKIFACRDGMKCDVCRREFWLAPLEEEE